MARTYEHLPLHSLDSPISFARPARSPARHVSLDSMAADVMTDLDRVPAVTISPDATLDDANQRMISSGVRLLFVTDGEYNLIGLITATDVIGDKPLRYLQEVGGKRASLAVRDVMTRRVDIDVMDMATVDHARVGNVVETLRGLGRQHALVLDRDEAGAERIRGIFSSTQIARQLGRAVENSGRANSFAELEAALTA